MPFDKKPSTWINNWYLDDGNIIIPVESFAELTEDEANPTTGDIRRVLFAILEQIYTKWNSTALEDRPKKVSIYRSTSVNDQTGDITKTYQFQFKMAVLEQEVESES